MAERQDAKERLIESARELFHSRSYGSVGVEQLCEHADVRRGSFYYYFSSKQALALAALDGDWESLRREVFDPAFSRTSPPLELFEKYWDLLYEYHRKRRARIGVTIGCPFANLGAELGTTDPLIREKVNEHLGRMTGYFWRALTEAVEAGDLSGADPSSAAERILVHLEGVLFLAKIRDDPELIRVIGVNPRALAESPAQQS